MNIKKNYWLEVLRGIAAFEVFFNHIFKSFSYFYTFKSDRLNSITNWATEAVIIFFILSGIVINYSQTNNAKTRNNFLKNRIVRLVPVFFTTVLLSFLLGYFLLNYKYDLFTYIGNLFFLSTLSGYIVQTIHENPPIWSLTFEVFFYLVFAFSISSFHSKFIRIWFVLSLIAMPVFLSDIFKGPVQHLLIMLSFSSVWLCGYFVYQLRNHFSVNKKTAILFILLLPLYSRLQFSTEYYDPLKYFIFALISSPFFLYLINSKDKKAEPQPVFAINNYSFLACYAIGVLLIILLSKSLFHNKLIYIVLPVLAFGLSFIRVKTFSFLELVKLKVSNFFYLTGSVSYSLYIIHMPVIFFVNHYTPVNKFYFGILVSILIIILVVYFLERIFQPFLNNYFKKVHFI